jgi:hypothetical protein
MRMKELSRAAAIAVFVLLAGVAPSPAADRDWQATERSTGTGPDARREIELRHKYDDIPGSRYNGSVGTNGYTVLKDRDGNSLRGFVTPDGTAILRDRDGNAHRVTTRQQP